VYTLFHTLAINTWAVSISQCLSIIVMLLFVFSNHMEKCTKNLLLVILFVFLYYYLSHEWWSFIEKKWKHVSLTRALKMITCASTLRPCNSYWTWYNFVKKIKKITTKIITPKFGICFYIVWWLHNQPNGISHTDNTFHVLFIVYNFTSVWDQKGH